MEDNNIMWVIEVLSQDGDFQAIEPICTENGLILQICPEYLVLWDKDVEGRRPRVGTHNLSLRAWPQIIVTHSDKNCPDIFPKLACPQILRGHSL
jgi:hypothetical protein